MVEGVKKSLDVSAKESGITLQVEGLHALPVIQANEKRLFTALYNLISNAIPEISSGGSITVTGQVDEQEHCVELVVADTGKGMPPEVRERLFTKNAISTKSGGTGLGTKIVKDAIDAHHGSIRVESTEGVGASFYLRLPIQQDVGSR